MEKVVNVLYSWTGSLARVEYFLYGILSSIISLALLALINPLLDLEGQLWVYASLGLLIAALLNATYTSVVLVAKRLRSMGFATENLWWIFGLWLITAIHSWGEPESTVTYSLTVVDVITSLWLLFTPPAKNS